MAGGCVRFDGWGRRRNDTFGAAVNLLKPIEAMMAEAAEGRGGVVADALPD